MAKYFFSATLEKEILDAMEELFDNTWFERLWVWQEIRLASESSIVVWGDNQIAWRDFCDTILCLEWKKAHRLYPGNPTIEKRLETIICMANGFDYMSFNTLLSVSRNSKCTDPRDRSRDCRWIHRSGTKKKPVRRFDTLFFFWMQFANALTTNSKEFGPNGN